MKGAPDVLGRRAARVGIGISILGAAVSLYLTIAHYADIAPACVNAGAIDCSAVTSSSYSLVPGTDIPITIPGLAWFATNAVAFAVAWSGRDAAWLPVAHFAFAVVAVLAVLYLVYAEIVVIHRICEWCTLVHLAVLSSFFLTLRRLQSA